MDNYTLSDNFTYYVPNTTTTFDDLIKNSSWSQVQPNQYTFTVAQGPILSGRATTYSRADHTHGFALSLAVGAGDIRPLIIEEECEAEDLLAA